MTHHKQNKEKIIIASANYYDGDCSVTVSFDKHDSWEEFALAALNDVYDKHEWRYINSLDESNKDFACLKKIYESPDEKLVDCVLESYYELLDTEEYHGYDVTTVVLGSLTDDDFLMNTSNLQRLRSNVNNVMDQVKARYQKKLDEEFKAAEQTLEELRKKKAKQ